MSSSTIAHIQTNLVFCGYSITMFFGNIGNVFVIIILSRQHENACSMYLLSAAIINIIYLTFYGFIQIFPVNYYDPTPTAFVLCKTFLYTSGVLGQTAKTLLVLASIDRFLVTSRYANIRRFSTYKRAKYLIIFTIIFWLLLSIHLPILTTIINGKCIGTGIYVIIRSIYVIIIVGLLPITILSTFSFLTYQNIRRSHVRVQPIISNVNISVQRRERSLLKLVISETIVYIITAGPYPLMFLETMISQYIISNKSIQYVQMENFMSSIVTFLLFINSAAPFYTYMIASKTFRHDFKQIICTCYRKIKR